MLTIATIEDSSIHTFRSLAPVVVERSRYLDVLGTLVAASNVGVDTQASKDVPVCRIWGHAMVLADERGTNIGFTDSSFM